MAQDNAQAADGLNVQNIQPSEETDHLAPVLADELDAAEQRVKDAQVARDELKKQKRERS